MKNEFVIGAPSLTGKGANEELDAAVARMEFPCSLQVVNHMPRAAIFPESGVELASSFASSGRSAEVKFASAAALKRLLRSAAQIAELNGYRLALVVTDETATEAVVEPVIEPADADTADATAEAITTNSDDDGAAAGEGSEAGVEPPAADPAPTVTAKAGGKKSKSK